MDIKRLDRLFVILCVITLSFCVADPLLGFYLNKDIILINRSGFWFGMFSLWFLLALRFRKMAYELTCQKNDADIRDLIRGAIKDPSFMRVIRGSVVTQKIPITITVGERQFAISSMEELEEIKRELNMI